jgi:hypothetical protein
MTPERINGFHNLVIWEDEAYPVYGLEKATSNDRWRGFQVPEGTFSDAELDKWRLVERAYESWQRRFADVWESLRASQ